MPLVNSPTLTPEKLAANQASPKSAHKPRTVERQSCLFPRVSMTLPLPAVGTATENPSPHGNGRVPDRFGRGEGRIWHPEDKSLKMQNEGESHDLIDNKGSNFLSHDVIDNKDT